MMIEAKNMTIRQRLLSRIGFFSNIVFLCGYVQYNIPKVYFYVVMDNIPRVKMTVDRVIGKTPAEGILASSLGVVGGLPLRS